MNQDKVKELLLAVEDAETDFSVIFSGKQSNKVNGLYKPKTREILIHNKNFTEDNLLIYTALHEFAHHLHCERKGGVLTGRAHTTEFWGIFHNLLGKAEEKGVYKNVFDAEAEFVALTEKIKKTCLSENGKIMKEFGRLMVEAEGLCRKHGARFEDFVDRVIGVPRATAHTVMKAFSYDVDPDLGYDAMKIVASVRNPEVRREAESAFRAGKTPIEVKASIRPSQEAGEPEERLIKERARIERTIESLERKLAEIDERLRTINN